MRANLPRALIVIFALSILISKTTPAPSAAPAGDSNGSSFAWNVGRNDLPLVSFPDKLSTSLDTTFSFRLGRFRFPLFQSLYQNRASGTFILMLLSEFSSKAEFVELERTGSGSNKFADRDSQLKLIDHGETKVLETSDGTRFMFARKEDGEFHCSEISEAAGTILAFNYRNNGLLGTINDTKGRRIEFHYVADTISAITQRWFTVSGPTERTWTIHSPAAPSNVHHTRTTISPRATSTLNKAMPSNALTPAYTRKMASRDRELAALFGGPGAVAAASGFEPAELARRYPLYRGDLAAHDGLRLLGHLSFAMHLYGSRDGTKDAKLYVPSGFTSHSSEPSPTDAAVTFFYPRLGTLTNITIAVFHIQDFQITYEGERVRIGSIGGRGGSNNLYRHSHIEFYRGKTGLPGAAARANLRIDPAVFLASLDERYLASL